MIPFVLLITKAGEQPVVIDLDEPGWMAKHADLMRATLSTWNLIPKWGDRPVLSLIVWEGEQPYYTARHVGVAGGNEDDKVEVVAYGIGKKRLDGHVDRLWAFSNGQVTLGDDVESIAMALLRNGSRG